MNEEVISAITSEIDGAFSSEKAVDIGMLTIKSANQTVEDASHRPDPEQLYLELWYEGEGKRTLKSCTGFNALLRRFIRYDTRTFFVDNLY